MSIIWGRKSPVAQAPDAKLIAHRNKLMGLWAAERMGMMGEAAVDYALGLLATEACKARDDTALVKKLCEDMSARGYPIGQGDVRRQLAVCAREAEADIPQRPGPWPPSAAT
jgi:hypothetical protein